MLVLIFQNVLILLGIRVKSFPGEYVFYRLLFAPSATVIVVLVAGAEYFWRNSLPFMPSKVKKRFKVLALFFVAGPFICSSFTGVQFVRREEAYMAVARRMKAINPDFVPLLEVSQLNSLKIPRNFGPGRDFSYEPFILTRSIQPDALN